MQNTAKHTFTLRRILNLFAALLLVLLTVVTSCTSRNFLKISADQSVEKTLNSNKATAAQLSCSSFLEDAAVVQQSSTVSQFFIAALFIFGISLSLGSSFEGFIPVKVVSAQKQAPLYILYKKRKILN